MSIPNANAIVARILDTFAGAAPLSNLDQLFTPGLVCYIDRLRMEAGKDGLETWYRYIHATLRRRHITIAFASTSLVDVGSMRYNVSGFVRILHRDATEQRTPFTATYLIKNGKVRTVWSTKTNYIGILGGSVALPLYIGVIYHCLRAWWYKTWNLS